MINELDEIKSLFDEFYLIDEPLISGVKENEIPIKINFEGGNHKGLVFAFANALSVLDKDMIHKLIHNAMKLTMQDIALVDLSGQPEITLAQMINIMKPKTVVAWGAQDWLTNEGLPDTKYEVRTYQDVAIVLVDSVSLFHDNVALKTVLWNTIQPLIK